MKVFQIMLPQNLVLYDKFYKIFYQSFSCPKTNFRSLVKESLIHQMLMTQLQEALQESYSIISDLWGNLLILNVVPWMFCLECSVGTLCYWSYICWLSSPAENHCNVVSIGQFYRYSFRRSSHGVMPLPSKVCAGLFSQKSFSWGFTFLDIFMRELFYMEGLMITSSKGRGSFTNVFPSNLNTVNLNVFPNHREIFAWR